MNIDIQMGQAIEGQTAHLTLVAPAAKIGSCQKVTDNHVAFFFSNTLSLALRDCKVKLPSVSQSQTCD